MNCNDFESDVILKDDNWEIPSNLSNKELDTLSKRKRIMQLINSYTSSDFCHHNFKMDDLEVSGWISIPDAETGKFNEVPVYRNKKEDRTAFLNFVKEIFKREEFQNMMDDSLVGLHLWR